MVPTGSSSSSSASPLLLLASAAEEEEAAEKQPHTHEQQTQQLQLMCVQARGRPKGSKDRVARKQRAEPLDLTRCKMDLLKIMLYTKDLAKGWTVDDVSRFLFAHTHGFRDWSRSRKIDSLALQMRTWLRRDIAPVVHGTRFFSSVLPPGAVSRHRHGLALNLLEEVAEWVQRGAPLDCFVAPLYEAPREEEPQKLSVQIQARAVAAVEHLPDAHEWSAVLHGQCPAATLAAVGGTRGMLPWIEAGARIWYSKRHADNTAIFHQQEEERCDSTLDINYGNDKNGHSYDNNNNNNNNGNNKTDPHDDNIHIDKGVRCCKRPDQREVVVVPISSSSSSSASSSTLSSPLSSSSLLLSSSSSSSSSSSDNQSASARRRQLPEEDAVGASNEEDLAASSSYSILSSVLWLL